MLTLDIALRIPANVSFSVVGEDAFLLNTHTNQYFALEEVGARLWALLSDGKPLRESYQILLDEYDVEPVELEQGILELIDHLMEHGLIEIVQE